MSRWSAWHRLGLAELRRRGAELELLHRAMGFATLALVTLAPLLIVVAAADPFGHGGFALWLVDGMALSGKSADALAHVFGPTRNVISTTSALSMALLALFGVSFASSVQNGYERIWKPASAPWHRIWRQVVWLAMLMVYLYAQVQTRHVLQGTPRILLSMGVGVLFFWWGPHFLLSRQVPWRYLLPGALATMAGLVGLRGFSYLVFTPLLVTNAISYGPVGTVLVVESWLVGVGFVVYGGALLGRLVCEWLGHVGGPGGPPDGTAREAADRGEDRRPTDRGVQPRTSDRGPGPTAMRPRRGEGIGHGHRRLPSGRVSPVEDLTLAPPFRTDRRTPCPPTLPRSGPARPAFDRP